MSQFTAFNEKNILVVGGAGFVGGNLVRLLLENAPEAKITIIDNLLSSERATVCAHQNVCFIEGSITDMRVLSNLEDRFDYIFHLATFHGNQSSIHDPIKDHENNTMTTLMLYERIKSFQKLQKVVYSSAGCSVAKKTFDTACATSEDSAIEINQDSPYSISKIIGEFYSAYYHKQHSLPVVRARFQNAYGPGEILGAGVWRGTPATVWRNVTPTFIYRSLCGEKLPLENAGEATRDFIFVEDICRGLMLCALNGKPGDVYNLGTGKETRIGELAAIINRLTENTTPVELLARRAWDHSGKRFADITKSKQELGFVAQTELEMGLAKTISWTKENIDFIKTCMHKHEGQLRCWEAVK